MIADTHGRGFVAPVVATLAPLRTMIRLALALRPVLLGPMLKRLPKPSYDVAPKWPVGATARVPLSLALGQPPGDEFLHRLYLVG